MNTIMFLGGAGLVAYAVTRPSHPATLTKTSPPSAEQLHQEEQDRRTKLALLGGGGLILGAILL